MMKLLVDIGNQRLKWRVTPCSEAEEECCEGTFDTHSVDFDRRLTQQWSGLCRPQSLWICSVAGEGIRQLIAAWVSTRWLLHPVWVSAQPEGCGVRNTYRDPTELGSDRWAALVGARALAPARPALVIDCGTAITVDAMNAEGEFLGGVIIPGLAAMHASLQQNTGEIRLPEMEPLGRAEAVTQIDVLGRSTRDAVANGALCAAAGGIERAVKEQRLVTDNTCSKFLTGGDATCLQPLLAREFELLPDLVLQGLEVISEQCGARR